MIKYLVVYIFLISIVSGQSPDSAMYLNEIGLSQVQSSKSQSYPLPLSLNLIDSRSFNNPDIMERKFNYPVMIGLGTVTAASVYLINNYYQNTWWRQEKTEFKIVNDWKYALWIDKIGHMYGTYLLSHAFGSGYEASGFMTEESVWYGSLSALALQLYVEIQDGYGPQWGFSPGDAVSDVLGSSYYVLKYYYPVLKDFQLRVSYFPSKEYLNGEKEDANIMDDYEGQKLWLSIRINKYLPKSIAEYWPSFLMLSFGYAVKNHQPEGYKDNEFYIAFDIDTDEIPLYGKGWQFVKNTLGYLHFPLPGLVFNPKLSFRLFAY